MEIPLSTCRVCLDRELVPVIPLGAMPPINRFLHTAEDIRDECRYDLTVNWCKTCTHLQLSLALDPTAVFSDYLYFSSMSDTFVAHGKQLAAHLKERFGLMATDLIVEIASNDGAVLRSFQELPMRVLGVEPAKNIAAIAREQGLPTVSEFFSESLAEQLVKEGQAKIIFGANVLAHVLDLRDFVRGLKKLLSPDGVIVIEVPYLADLLEAMAFDTIYHEHLSYFRLAVLDRLFASEGLTIFDVERLPIHGGSIRVFVGLGNNHSRQSSVDALITAEQKSALDQESTYHTFAERILTSKEEARRFLGDLKSSGKRFAAYGAAAKGNVFLNYCGLGTETFPWIADRSTYKQGWLTPGTHIPVVHPDEVLIRQPDILVILAWNVADEVMAQLRPFAERGGQFAVLLPHPHIIRAV